MTSLGCKRFGGRGVLNRLYRTGESVSPREQRPRVVHLVGSGHKPEGMLRLAGGGTRTRSALLPGRPYAGHGKHSKQQLDRQPAERDSPVAVGAGWSF